MIEALLRTVPLPFYRPLRQLVLALPRRHPARIAATLVLQQAARAYRNRLVGKVAEIRPLDDPAISFEVVDSMVMDAVFWFGVRGYEGVVPRVWRMLCRHAQSVLEVGGNVGFFTVVGASVATGSYTVVEPVPEVAATLRANVRRNGLDRVELLQGAVVAGEARAVTLNLPDEGRDMPVGAHLLDQVEIAGRSSRTHITVDGLAFRTLSEGRDLIKIDAEGIEAALLADVRDMLLAHRPTLLVEVLPEARRLGEMLASLAAEAGYLIHVLPEYGSDQIVTVPAGEFTAELPMRHRAKDVLLSVQAIV